MSFPPQQLGLHSSRLSSMSPRTYGSMIASADGGGGSMSRVYKWAVFHTHITAPQFLSQYLGFKPANIRQGRVVLNFL